MFDDAIDAGWLGDDDRVPAFFVVVHGLTLGTEEGVNLQNLPHQSGPVCRRLH